MKKIVIIQSNYIPWRGYFDMVASADEVILYDDVQFTKNDWRNRNQIKTPKGLGWMTVPVGQHISRRIRDVELHDNRWQEKHWRTLECNYRRAPHFRDVALVFEPLYRHRAYTRLSELNRALTETVCAYLGITTKISNSWDYEPVEGQTERLVDLCVKAGATEYISGPAARAYIKDGMFSARGIQIHWFDYSDYPAYPQLWGDFIPTVTILDLLFNCGRDAPRYMKHVRP